jgi:hypothetical protein
LWERRAIGLHAGFERLRDDVRAHVGEPRWAGRFVKNSGFADIIHGFLTLGAILPSAGRRALLDSRGVHAAGGPRLNPRQSERPDESHRDANCDFG